MVWSAIAFAIFFAFSRDTRSSILVGFLVLSHWIGDFISHNHILPIAFSDSPRVGLGLYSSLPVMVAVDFTLFGAALAYLFALMPLTLLPGKLLIIFALGMTLVVPFGMWIDRHRSVN